MLVTTYVLAFLVMTNRTRTVTCMLNILREKDDVTLQIKYESMEF